MSKIRIKNFGPVKEGFAENDGWIVVQKVTVFIGNQGSGKSTVAKLISTMTWLEKALVRGDFGEKELKAKNSFKKHCAYQNIGSYFKDDSSIEYEGKAFHITYKGGNITVRKNEENGYSFPKVMYVPAERNFVSSVRNVSTLKGLPSTLYTFSDEYINAVELLEGQLELPINDVKFEYQKLNRLSWIIGEDYKIKLSESSSGFQSLVPLYIVTAYLSNKLRENEDNAVKEISIEEDKRIRKEIELILSNPNISSEVKQASLEFLSSKFTYSAFINIVEEPEQNLFPSSQYQVLNSLLTFNNTNERNGLIMTTHSPYLINYLTLAVKANELKLRMKDESLKVKLDQIVPLKATVNARDLGIYEFDEKDGSITKLEVHDGLPSDDNKLNERLGESNEIFARLLEIQQEL